MKKTIGLVVALAVASAGAIRAEPEGASWSPEQREILDAIDGLSAATAPGGGGADAYAAFLAEGYSRWTLGGGTVNDKASWVEGVREWFDDGWRVSDRQADVLGIDLRDGLAFVRRVVTETFLGPEGETSTATAALAEVWVGEEGRWRLLRVDVHPLERP